MSEHGRSDTAGATPSNGRVIQGVRLITSSTPKMATLATSLAAVVIPFYEDEWTIVSLTDDVTGEPLAARRFDWQRQARHARHHIEAALHVADPDARASDLQALVDAAPTRRRDRTPTATATGPIRSGGRGGARAR